MLIVKLGKKENINQALKRFKRKVSKTKLIKQLRENKFYEKPSAKKRKQKLKAIYTRKFQEKE